VKNFCSANYCYMTHDIYVVKTRISINKQMSFYVNDGFGLNKKK